MESIPALLAKLESEPDDLDWLCNAQLAMRQIAERYRKSPIDPLEHERNVEALDRLADLIYQYNLRLQAMLPPRG
jgi:hypothetical protein